MASWVRLEVAIQVPLDLLFMRHQMIIYIPANLSVNHLVSS
jgi:hypothetical protein